MSHLPTVFFVDPDQLKRDLSSPEMRGLIECGYTIGPAMLWQDSKSEPPKLALIMRPPIVWKEKHAGDVTFKIMMVLLSLATTVSVVIVALSV